MICELQPEAGIRSQAGAGFPCVLRGDAPLPLKDFTLGRVVTYLSPEDHGEARSVEDVLAARLCQEPERIQIVQIPVLASYEGEAALVAVFCAKKCRAGTGGAG